jgi:hypothetical protein
VVVRKVGKRRDPDAEPMWQTHVYLSLEEIEALKRFADRDSRSMTKQIRHYIRLALQRERQADRG